MSIRTGIGGWVYPDWRKGNFYPDGLPQKNELQWASRHVGAIEINSTYRSEASRVFRRLLFVRRSYDERYEEQVFA